MNAILKNNYVALQTILRKEVIRFLRIWSQSLLPPIVTITLYFIIFGKMIGSQIRDIEGFTYMQYLVPGLAMMTIITNSYINTASSFFTAKFSKSVEEMLVSSMPNYIMLLGYVLSGALRGVLVGVCVLFVAYLFTHFPISHLEISVLMGILAALLFSLAGFINGIFAKKFDDVSFIPTFVLTPLTYLGGVFYSIQQLPPFWQKISLLNPILNMIDTFRYGMLGITDVNIYFGFVLVSGLFLLLLIWSLYLLQKGVGLRT